MSENEQTVEVQNEAPQISDKEMRGALKELSTELFGASSRWQKLKSVTVPKTIQQTKEDGTVETVYATSGLARVMVTKQNSDEEILGILLNMKAQRDARILKAKQDSEARETAMKIQQEAAGSAI